MPTLHPKIAHVLSVKDRASTGATPSPDLQSNARRLISTYEMVMGIVFAGPEADEVAHGLHELHRPISGTMPDGPPYHAWNNDVWNWTWGGSILEGGIDIADAFGLFRTDDEREQAYRALVEIGRRYGVRSLPGTHADFLDYWTPVVEETLAVGPEVRFIVDHATTLAKPRGLGPCPPHLLWRLMSLPATRTIRVGILAGVPERFHSEMGLRITLLDRIERQIHALFWRSVPRPIAGWFAPTYFGCDAATAHPDGAPSTPVSSLPRAERPPTRNAIERTPTLTEPGATTRTENP